MANAIRIMTVCSNCKRSITVIATEYKVHNQDGSLHTCNKPTFKDCSEYIRVTAGDESQSRCKITGKLCDADEAGLVCRIWEDEKAELLRSL